MIYTLLTAVVWQPFPLAPPLVAFDPVPLPLGPRDACSLEPEAGSSVRGATTLASPVRYLHSMPDRCRFTAPVIITLPMIASPVPSRRRKVLESRLTRTLGSEINAK